MEGCEGMADEMMLRPKERADDGVSALDRSLALMRMKPLSREELDALGKIRMKQPKMMPHMEFKEIKVDGKMRMVPIVGIRLSF